MTPLLQTENLGFGWSEALLLCGLNLAIGPGVGWIGGGDGCGKTSLLRLLAGELKPSTGRLRLRQVDAQQHPSAYRAQVCWIDPQGPQAESLKDTTPRAFFGAWRARGALPSDPAALDAIGEGLGLAPHLDKPMYMLSNGSRRKVWITATLASPAPLRLLDMPFAALDPPSIRFLLTQLQAAAERSDQATLVADYQAPDGVRLSTEFIL